MKGIVFTELIEFVEEALGFEIADQMIGNAGLANEGAFTQAGNYPFEDLQKLVVSLSAATGKPAGDLLYLFGQYLFGRLIKLYPVEKSNYNSVLDFIATVDEIVHVEVHKLYPDADLPRFFVESNENGTLVMIYESQKKLEPFAHGLIDGCAEVFGEKVKTEYQTISETPHQAKFTIQLHHD